MVVSDAERSRVRILWMVALLTNCMVECLCVTQSIYSGYASSSISNYMIVVDGYDDGLVLKVLVLFGLAGWMIAVFGTVLICNGRTPLKVYGLRHQFLSYFGWGSVLFVTYLIAAVCIYRRHDFDKEFARGFNVANYSRDSTVRSAIDSIQTDFRCCGNHNYTEWLAVPATDHASSRLVSIPESCCNYSTNVPCVHVVTSRLRHRLTPNSRGCLKVISSNYSKILLVRAGLLTAAALLELVVLVILFVQLRKVRMRPMDHERPPQNLSGKSSEPKNFFDLLGFTESEQRLGLLSASKENNVKDRRKDNGNDKESSSPTRYESMKTNKDPQRTNRNASANKGRALERQGSKWKASAASNGVNPERTSGTTSGKTSGANSGRTTGANSEMTSGTTSGKTSGVTSGRTSGANSERTAVTMSGRTTGANSGRTTGANSGRTTGTISGRTAVATPGVSTRVNSANTAKAMPRRTTEMTSGEGISVPTSGLSTPANPVSRFPVHLNYGTNVADR